jgi:hypothetical protein
MSSDTEDQVGLLNRREAIRRVSVMLGGVAFVGGSALLTACEKGSEKASVPADGAAAKFTAEDIAYLDEIADTILPDTKTPGAKAAKTGAFIAVMVTDCYDANEQKVFRDGMKKVDDACKKANNVSFMSATPQQRLAVLTALDAEQKSAMDAREAADRQKKAPAAAPAAAPADPGAKKADASQRDQRAENATGKEASSAAAISADAPPHYFRMMKELTLLGYFTSEIGYTKAMRYVESPGRFDPCATYTPGEPAWASHA